MVKLTQDIQAAFEVETTYGAPPDTTLYHLGLLDTFDPREVEMNITPVASIGQSTDSHHSAGPIAVTLPLKIALQGTGWQELLSNAIGKTDVYGSVNTPHSLTTSTYSHAIIAKDTSTTQHTLCTGVVVNEATLEADYTAGGYMTLDCACTALYSEDDDDGDFTFNPTGSGADTYNSVAFPSAPTSDPLLPTDLTVSYAAATENEFLITGTAGTYVEVGERYMRFYTEADALHTDITTGGGVVSAGVIDLTNGNTDTITILKDTIHGKSNWSLIGTSEESLSVNLLKGIYKMTGSSVTIPNVNSTTAAMTSFSNLKTVSLKIANNNIPIPSLSGGYWLQNAGIARGKADITLDLTMTAEDETLYDIYRGATAADRVIPLVRLDFGAGGSIALTNGTITSFTRPLSAAGEVVDTLSIKFRGNGDYKNYSAFAISTDITLQ